MTITKTVLGAVVLALLVTLPAQAQLPQTLDEMKAHMDAVASHLALDLGMSETELAAFWPQRVEKLGDLPPVVATINNPDRLNGLLGEGAAFKKGDFAALSPFASDLGKGYSVAFHGSYGYGQDKSSPKLAKDIGVEDFYGAVEKAGLQTVGGAGKSIPKFLLATIVDPEVFGAAFTGEGEVARGQLIVLKPGEKGATAYIGPAKQPASRRFIVSEGKVSEIK